MVDRSEAFFDPEMREQIMWRDGPSMRDLETRLPWQQLDFRPPHRTDEHAILLRTTEARATAETEEPRAAHNGTRFFQNLPVKSLFPGFITLGAASRPAPSNAVIADQNDLAVRRDAESISSMRRPGGRCDRRMPGSEPIAAVRVNRKFFAVERDPISKHFH